MNECIRDLLLDDARSGRLARGLPEAFEIAGLELPSGNPAVGFLREHIITGFFIREFGNGRVELPDNSNERGYDVTVCGERLSIKTKTGSGSIKILWTPDSYRAGSEVTAYTPQHDMLLVHIFWGTRRDSVFYIPDSVQWEIYNNDPDNYLIVRVGTNHRGADLTTVAKNALLNHHDTIRLEVDWVKRGLDYAPHDRWVDFWQDRA